MNRKLVLLGTLVLLVLAALATAIAADEENRLFLPAVSGGVPNAVSWTPTSTATTTPTQEIVQPPDDLIDCSNPDYAGLPECQGGATATPASSVTVTSAPTDQILPPDDLIDCSNPDFASLPECQGGATATPGGTIP